MTDSLKDLTEDELWKCVVNELIFSANVQKLAEIVDVDMDALDVIRGWADCSINSHDDFKRLICKLVVLKGLV